MMALSRFRFSKSSSSSCDYLKLSSKTASFLLLLSYLYASIAMSESNGAALSPYLVCRDAELNGLPRVQKICSALKQMAESNPYIDEYYNVMPPKAYPQRADASEPNHVFLRFGRRR